MHIELTVSGGDEGVELRRLLQFLQGVDDLRGQVELTPAEPRAGEMGTASDVVSVVLGPGGTGVALAGALSIWLRSRTGAVKIIAKRRDADGSERSVEIDVRRADDPEGIFRYIDEVLRNG